MSLHQSALIGVTQRLLQLPISLQLVLVASAILLPYTLYHFFLHPLAGLPGPLSAKLGLPLFPFLHAYRRDYVWALAQQHARHGPIVRIAPNHVSFTSAHAVEKIYAHGSAKYLKTDFYKSFQVYWGRPSLFSDVDPHSHADRRRAMASAYAMSYLVKLEECVEPCVDLLVEQFERMVGEAEKSKASIDMAKWMHFFAMDAVGELAFGRGFEFLEKGSDPDNFLLGVSNLSHWGSMAGFLTPLLSRPARVVLKWLSGEPGGEVVGVATRARIDARYKAEAAGLVDRQDMLTKIIRAKHPSTGRQYDANDSLRTAISVVGAGSDTTSVALSAFFGYLVRNGKVYEDLQREIDEAFERGDLSLPAKYSKGVQLELLQACIKETLRLHPPISMSLPRLVPHGGDVIDGRFFPANTNVSVSSFVLHRTKEAFGDDAAEWNPYRWIGLDEQTRREMERVNLSFGAGNRQCIGKNISLMEITKVLPTLLYRFRFDFVPRDNSQRRRVPRDSNGSEAEPATTPWRTNSTWFLDVEDLVLEVSQREV